MFLAFSLRQFIIQSLLNVSGVTTPENQRNMFQSQLMPYSAIKQNKSRAKQWILHRGPELDFGGHNPELDFGGSIRVAFM